MFISRKVKVDGLTELFFGQDYVHDIFRLDKWNQQNLQCRKNRHELAELMEGYITENELRYCLFSKMKRHSAPGIDGFTLTGPCLFGTMA